MSLDSRSHHKINHKFCKHTMELWTPVCNTVMIRNGNKMNPVDLKHSVWLQVPSLG